MTRLRIGIGLFTGQRATPAGPPRHGDAVPLCRAAEEAGFDSFWVSEHHGWSDDYLPSPLILLSALASTTSRISLATGLVLAPMAHPIRLAEDAALVDRLSNGRLILGLGLGYAEAEYAAFGVDPSQRGRRLEDLVGFLRRAWTGATFDWSGPCWAGTGLRVTPRPVAAGGIPIWLGGYAPRAVDRARRIADGHVVGRSDPVVLDAVFAGWAPAARPFTVAVNAIVILTDDRSDASSLRAGFRTAQRSYEDAQRDGIAHAGLVSGGATQWTDAEVDGLAQAVGTPKEVVGALRQLIDRLPPADEHHLVLRVLFPEDDLDTQLRRIGRLGAVAEALRG